MIEEEVKGKELDNEIFKVVIKKLEDKNQWFANGAQSIHHKTENICLNYDLDFLGTVHTLEEPEHIKAPRKYNRQIQKLVRNILGFNTNEKKLFALDYVNGEYPEYIDLQKIPQENYDDFMEWLKEEVREPNYVMKSQEMHNSTIYFKREADHAFMVLKWL